MNCLVCGTECPLPKKHGSPRRYCTSKCSKTMYRRSHPERDREAKEKWIFFNPEKRKKSSAEYQQKNKAYYNQYASLRSRKVKQAKPPWLNEFQKAQLDEIYDLAQKTNLEVDHIVPIKHAKVCGLHVPWNLQLLTRTQNAIKSNHFDEDVVAILSKKEPLDG